MNKKPKEFKGIPVIYKGELVDWINVNKEKENEIDLSEDTGLLEINLDMFSGDLISIQKDNQNGKEEINI